MATKKLSIALAALTTPTFGFMVTMPSFTLGATLITATGAEINYLVGVTSAIQAQITAKLASASYTAADVLAKLITVDGVGSGVDADLLDGVQGALYARLASPTFTGNVTGTFVGNITGDVLGNVTGMVTGNASSATATGITNDTTTNATMYPTWVTANAGNLPQKVSSTKIWFNPSTGELCCSGDIVAFATP